MTVRVGSLLSIELPANPGGAGYAWALERQPGSQLELVDSSFIQSNAATGSGGVQRWTLRALAPGDTRLKLKYWRPWEGEASVIDRFDVALHVRAAQ